jgi:hypothetical protein
MAKPKKASIAEYGGVKYYMGDDGRIVDNKGEQAPAWLVKTLLKEGEIQPKNDVGATISPAFSRSLGMNIAPQTFTPAATSATATALQTTSGVGSEAILKKIETNTKQTNTLLQALLNQSARQFEEQNELLRRSLLNAELGDNEEGSDGPVRQRSWMDRLMGRNSNPNITPTDTPAGGGGSWFDMLPGFG